MEHGEPSPPRPGLEPVRAGCGAPNRPGAGSAAPGVGPQPRRRRARMEPGPDLRRALRRPGRRDRPPVALRGPASPGERGRPVPRGPGAGADHGPGGQGRGPVPSRSHRGGNRGPARRDVRDRSDHGGRRGGRCRDEHGYVDGRRRARGCRGRGDDPDDAHRPPGPQRPARLASYLASRARAQHVVLDKSTLRAATLAIYIDPRRRVDMRFSGSRGGRGARALEPRRDIGTPNESRRSDIADAWVDAIDRLDLAALADERRRGAKASSWWSSTRSASSSTCSASSSSWWSAAGPSPDRS